MKTLWKWIAIIGSTILSTLLVVTGIKSRRVQKDRVALEKELDKQKKKIVNQRIDVANREYDLQVMEEGKATETAKEKVKKEIEEKRAQLHTDEEALAKLASDLEEAVKTEGKGSITKVK